MRAVDKNTLEHAILYSSYYKLISGKLQIIFMKNEKSPTVLFVDDELGILKSLTRLMQDEDWDCHFLTSSKAALELLEKQQIDLIVSDVAMPQMDGIELLNLVKDRYPSTVRIFLTAFADQDNVTQALSKGFTQQIIPKPWIDQELKEVIRSALRQSAQQRQHCPELQALLNTIPLLPPLPDNYSQVRSCVIGDEVDIEKMAEIISLDVAMATSLLHWSNSALFGQRFQVDTVKKAIVVLGTDVVESLILSEAINKSIASHMPDVPGFHLKDFQHHSIATAIISRQLIKTLYINDSERQDRAFIAGLLHDMGKLAAASFFSAQFTEAIALAENSKCYLTEAEKQVLGTTHTEIGSFLAEWWALPPFITHAVLWHHDPKSSPIENDVVNAVHVANLLSYQFNLGSNGDSRPREVDRDCWDKFYLTEEGVEILRVETEKMLEVLCG